MSTKKMTVADLRRAIEGCAAGDLVVLEVPDETGVGVYQFSLCDVQPRGGAAGTVLLVGEEAA